MENLERERNAVKSAVEIARLMGDQMKQHERENKRLWAALVASIVALLIMAGVMVYGIINAQHMMNDAVLNALNTVTDMEVVSETTTTVTQDSGEGEGNNVYQAGESADYYESGAE